MYFWLAIASMLKIFASKKKTPGKFGVVIIVLIRLLIGDFALAQNAPVALSLNNVSFNQLFDEIAQQTHYVFFYNTETLQDLKPISVHVKNMSLKEVLELCFKGQPLTYSVVDHAIMVKQKDASVQNMIKINNGSLSGIVRESKTGDPIVGAAVKLCGLDQQMVYAITNSKGYYSFSKIRSGKYKLVFSFIGYVTLENNITLNEDQHFIHNITLSDITGHLNDIVVVGYGTMKNKDLTGAVSSINANDIKNVPYVTVDNALAGKVPGLQVTKADGSPGGAVRMRLRGGMSFLDNNEPLYIIDGIPLTVNNSYIQTSGIIVNAIDIQNDNYMNEMSKQLNGIYERGLNSLSCININDIESIDILKDASSSAIYGSKAANGVVIITTKSGKINTKPQVNFNYYAGINIPIIRKVLNKDQYKEIMAEANQNAGDFQMSAMQNSFYQTNGIQDSSVNTDWLKLVMRKAFTQGADFSIRGGSSVSSYYSSISYNSEQGVLTGTGFKRIAGKINLEHARSTRFRLLTNVNWGYTKNDLNSGLYFQALHAPPDFVPNNTKGLNSFYSYTLQNPLTLKDVRNQGQEFFLLGRLAAEYDINKNLKLKSTVSLNSNTYNQLQFIPSYVISDNSSSSNDFVPDMAFGAKASSFNTDVLYENTLTWDKHFNKDHQLNLLAGTSLETDKFNYTETENNVLSDKVPFSKLAGTIDSARMNSKDEGSSGNLLSFYARANYSYKHNYLLTLTARADASSKFPPANKIGYFPSAAFAWRISGESFLKNQLWIDDLKLRVSMGKTGLYAITGNNIYGNSYSIANYASSKALIPVQAENDHIKWESIWQKDMGIDFTLFKSRLSGTIGYYQKTNDMALLSAYEPPSVSYINILDNAASISNKGFEINLQANIIRSDKFTWNISVNIAHNSSKVCHIDGASFSSPRNRYEAPGTSIVEQGKPLGLLYGYLVKGILKTPEEVERYRKKLADPSSFYVNLGVGDYEYELDKSGHFQTGIIGNGNPKFYGGFTQDFTFKGFSLNALITYSYGNQLIYQDDLNDMTVFDPSNKGPAILNRFTPQHTDTNRPRLVWGQQIYLSKNNVYDASYLKMRTLTLGYTLPGYITKKWKMKNVFIYVTATNLFTITRYPGPDPEISDAPSSTISGYRDVSSYPTYRSFVLGFKVPFV